MKIILCIASLLNLCILHGICNVLQSFDEADMMSCHFHFVCDLNETRKVRQIEAECSDQAIEVFGGGMKEAFGLEGQYSTEHFELYREHICNLTDEERKNGFKELGVILFERTMVACMDLSSEICKEVDNVIGKWADYSTGIMESEECNKIKELVIKSGEQTMFG